MKGQKLNATREEKTILQRVHAMAEHADAVAAYYVPAHDTVTLRNTNPPGANRNALAALPADAVLLGRYAQPVDGQGFVGDLRAVRGL